MKKIIGLLLVMFLLTLSTIAFADEGYTFYVGNTEQSFMGIAQDGEIYFPLKELSEALGAESYKDANINKEFHKIGEEVLVVDLGQETIYLEEYPSLTESSLLEVNGALHVSLDMLEWIDAYYFYQNDQSKTIYCANVEVILKQLEEKSEAFKLQEPALFEAAQKMVEAPYGFNVDWSANVRLKYDDAEMAAMTGLYKVFFGGHAYGYMNLPKEMMEMNLDMKIDAGSFAQEAIEDYQIKLVNKMLYLFDPQSETWSSQSMDESQFEEYDINTLQKGSASYLWIFSDYLEKTETEEGKITYTVKLMKEDIKALIDEYIAPGAYDTMVQEMDSQEFSGSFDGIELTYAIEDGFLRAQHLEVKFSIITPEVTAAVSANLDSIFYSYGLEKDVLKPVEKYRLLDK